MSKHTSREFFAALLETLSPEAQKCDVGLYVREAGGAFVNNFTEGRELTIRERLNWITSKMNERRIGGVTLAGLFPKDAQAILAVDFVMLRAAIAKAGGAL